MRQGPEKAVITNCDSSLSDSASGGNDEKTIPFLRRLRDMLQENEGTISFIPGHRRNGQVALGRLVVHDRIEVEAKVLPRYFNHSSFASLRRQLNYFNFTRVGRGRQRDSTYINDGVVELEDILTLRRRPVGTTTGGQQAATATTNHLHSQGRQETTTTPRQQAKVVKEKIVAQQQQPTTTPLATKKTYVESIVPVVHLPRSTVMRSSSSFKSMAAKRAKRNSVGQKHQQPHKKNNKKLTLPRVNTPPFVSEDEESHHHHHHQEMKQQKHVALDLTVPPPTDPELLEGCTALLGLSGKLFLG